MMIRRRERLIDGIKISAARAVIKARAKGMSLAVMHGEDLEPF